MSNGAGLLSLVKLGFCALPADVRLDIARDLIGFCTDQERTALAELGGEPVADRGEPLDTEGEG